MRKKIIRVTLNLADGTKTFTAQGDNRLQSTGLAISTNITYGNGAISPTAQITIYGLPMSSMAPLFRVQWNTMSAILNTVKIEVGEQGGELTKAYEGNITFATINMSAAFIKAGTGCSWNGNTDVIIIADGYDHTPPTYPIKILRPEFKDVYFKVIVQDKSKVSFVLESQIKQQILSAVSSGEKRFRIFKNILPADYICGLPSIGLKSIVASFDGLSWFDELSIGLDQFPSLDAFRISIEES